MFKWAQWPPEFTLATTADFGRDFPNLRPHLCEDDVSPGTHSYNCIAWAASDTTAWWEPDPFYQYYWPDGVMRDYTLSAYISAFRTIGYELCDDGTPESNVEKIVIFTLGGRPKHAARLLQDGNWTSKFGDFEDIKHADLGCVSGPLYGSAHRFMKRPVS